MSRCPCPDYPEPIEGPVERDITYIAPFTRCDREDDYLRCGTTLQNGGWRKGKRKHH